MRSGRTLFAFVAAWIGVVASVGGAPPRDEREIVVGLPTALRVRGLVTEDASGEVDGFTRRVLQEAADFAGLRVRFVKTEIGEDPTVPLLAGEIDVFAPIAITEPRVGKVAFTAPIFTARGAVYAREGTAPARTAAELKGKRVAVAGGGVAHQWMAEQGLSPVMTGTLREVIKGVLAGEADYLVTPQAVARVELELMGESSLREWELKDETFWRSFAFATRLEDVALAADLNRGLGVLRERGRLDELYDQWVARYQPRPVRAAVPMGVVAWVGGGLVALVGAAGISAWVTRRKLLRRSAELAKREMDVRTMEAAKSQAEANLRDVAETLESVVWLYDTKLGRQLYVNGAFERVWKQTLEDLERNPDAWLERVHPDDRARVEREVKRSKDAGDEYSVEYRVVCDGETRWFRSRSRPVRGDGTRRAGVAHDITDLKRAEEALRASEAGYRSIFQGSHDGVLVIDPVTDRVAAANPAACEMYGYPESELVGLHMSRLSTDWDAGRGRMQALLREGSLTPFVVRQRRADGSEMDVEIAASAIEFRGAPAVISLNRVVTDRVLAETLLRKSEERYRSFVSNSAEGVWRFELREAVDTSLKTEDQIEAIYAQAYLAECNDAFARMYGLSKASEIIGASLGTLMVREDPMNEDFLRAFIASGYRLSDVISHERDVRGNSRYIINSLVGIVESGRLVRAWGTQRDVTASRAAEEERRVLQERLDRATRLETLGLLSGGIAHDINNILAAIMGSAGLAARKASAGQDISPHLRMIEEAVARGSDLTRQLLASAGRGPLKQEPVDLREIVRGTVELLTCALEPKHVLTVDSTSTSTMATADATQVRQVIMNLVRNASEAIGTNRGEISVRTGMARVEVGPEWTVFGTVDDTERACIEVRDTGPGIARAEIERIVEPFFSTKGPGRGLGLAAALGIVRGHGGLATVKSTPGLGTTFRVYLPVATGKSASSYCSVVPLNEGTGSVLVIDDDRAVREVFCECLRGAGFVTACAPDGDLGVRHFAERRDEIAAVVLDMVMPGKSGEQAFREIRAIRSDVPVIVISGNARAEALATLAAEPGVLCLAKPIEPEGLIEAVRRVIAEATTCAAGPL